MHFLEFTHASSAQPPSVVPPPDFALPRESWRMLNHAE